MISPDLRARVSRPILVLVAGIAIAAIAVAIIARLPDEETRAKARIAKAQELGGAARAALESGNTLQAREQAELARKLDPGAAEASRVLAQLLADTSPRKAIVYSRELTASPHATREDWALHAKLCRLAGLREEGAAAARHAGDALVVRGSDNDPRRAMQTAARDLHAANPDDPASALVYARLMLRDDPDGAIRLLEPLAAMPGPAAQEALRILAGSASFSDQVRLRAADRLTENADAPLADVLLATRARVDANPDRRSELAESLLASRLPKGGSAEWSEADRAAVAALVGWLCEIGLPKRGVELLSASEAVRDPVLAVALAQALLAAGSPKEARDLIDDAGSKVPALESERLLAAAATAMGDPQAAQRHWNRAFLQLRGSKDAESIARMLRMAGGGAESDPEMIQRYLEAMLRRGNTFGLLAVTRELASAFPENPDIENNLHYYRLLLRESPLPDPESVLALVKAHPGRVTYRTTLALACLAGGQTAEAREAIAPIEQATSGLSDGDLAIVAVVLAKSGDPAQAVRVRSGIRLERLLPEERALLTDHVGRYLADEAAFAKRIAELRERRETRALLAVLKSRAALYPKDAPARREYAYLRALASAELPEAERELRELRNQDPADQSSRIFLAFVLLRQGKSEAAAEEVKGVPWNAERPPEEQMILAAVVAANSTARLKEEEEFLRTWVIDPTPAAVSSGTKE